MRLFNRWRILLQKNETNRVRTIIVAFASAIFVFVYPFISYLLQQYDYGSILPVLLVLLISWRGFNSAKAFQRNSLFAIAGLILAGAIFLDTMTSQLIPVIIYLVLGWFFGRTLLNPPSLIERFVSLQFSEIPEEVLDYCRRLTIVWTGLFVIVVIASIVLMVTGRDWYLTLLHGVIVWLLMAALAVVEHVYRIKRFPFMKGQMPSIRETLHSAVKSRDQLW